MSKSDPPGQAHSDGIAVVGLACRFPGARSIDEFWQNLRDGLESVSFFSDQELEASGVDPAMRHHPNYIKAGAILEDVELFEADFFGVTTQEAEMMDPQHRLLLECAWEALESSGYAPESYQGSIGVYAGSRISEYLLFNQAPPDLVGLQTESPVTNFQRLIGNDKDYLTTRISFKLNLKGPSISVQTACSTSLVAVHLACESLLNGECDLALAGGVAIRVPQKAGYLYSEGMIFSPDGHTRAFDAKAGGTIFSSGAGLVALKRLDEALADGDTIHAVIRGSAINNDGSALKAGYTAPSMDGQAEVIAQALAVAEVRPETVTYIETHGTGTALGDLVEIAALTRVFRLGTEAKNFCAIGSVKTNVGHTVQAAGIAGLIKTILMLKHKLLAPSLNFESPNPQLDLANSPFYVNTELSAWGSDGTPRRAGVSSFGVGGTNAHVVLEEAPVLEPVRSEAERSHHLLCLSAKREDALKELASRYERYLATQPAVSLEDVCFTAAIGRSHFSNRLAVVADSFTEMGQGLAAFSAGEEMPDVLSQALPPSSSQPKVAFLFTGQGSQYVSMGYQLYQTQPTFRSILDRCDELLRPYLKQPLLAVLYPEAGAASLLDETAYTQPTLFALEYALARLWQSWGIEPAVVMGHSVGEYVAACVAGVFSLEDGLTLIAKRGQLMQELPPAGEMAVVLAGESQVATAVAPYGETVSIAAINGPENTVISGDRESIQEILGQLESVGIRARRLTGSHAFHSPLMESMLDPFEQTAANIAYAPARLKLISNLTGQLVEDGLMAEASYWRRHVRETVRFSTAMETLSEQGCEIFMEIGPNPILLGMGRRCVPEGAGIWLPSLREGRPDWQEMLRSLARLYVYGVKVDWVGFEQDYPRQRVELPTYPFQRQRYWLEPATRRSKKSSGVAPPKMQPAASHPLLGQRIDSPLREIQFQARLSSDSLPFLPDHRVHDIVTLPATAFLEMVQAAAIEALGSAQSTIIIEDFVVQQALLFCEDHEQTVQFILTPQDVASANFQIFSFFEADVQDKEPSWTLLAAGKVRLEPADTVRIQVSLEAIQAQCPEPVPVDLFYQRKRERGMNHGQSFQGIEQLWRKDGEAVGQIRLPEPVFEQSESYQIHPALLDTCLQVSEAAFPGFGRQEAEADLYLPVVWERVKIYGRAGTLLWSHAFVRPQARSKREVRTVDLRLYDEAGQILVEIEGLHFKRASRAALRQNSAQEKLDDWLYEIEWQPKRLVEPVSPQPGLPGSWLIFADQAGLGIALARLLEQQSRTCVLVFPGEVYDRTAGGHFKINPEDSEDFRRLFRELPETGELSNCEVVYMWGLTDGPAQEITASSLLSAQALICGSVLHLVQALALARIDLNPTDTESLRLWLVTRGTQAVGLEPGPVTVIPSPLWGLGRTLLREQPDLRCMMVDLDPTGPAAELQAFLAEHSSKADETQVAFRGSVRYVPRLVRSAVKARLAKAELSLPGYRPYRLKIDQPGDLDHLGLYPVERRSPGPGEVELRVHVTGLNFRDILNALGKLSGPIGWECSGTIVACGEGVTDLAIGDAVMAMVPECFSTFVTVKVHCVVPKPEHLSFEEAATIPLAFLTASYGLQHLAKISEADRILIHAAAGGVGQAAVQLAQRAGAEIFGTASRRKWAHLTALGVQHVMDSRSLDFADEVMTRTAGKGVNVVLNSLAGAYIPKSLSVLGTQGRFVELGATDTWPADQVAQTRPDLLYFEFHLSDLAEENPALFQTMFRDIATGFREGVFKPLPRRVFPIQQAVSAFRTMAQAQHIGKIVVSHQAWLPESSQTATTNMNKEGTYLITGGLGGLGLKLARWLGAQGARHLVLLARRKPAGAAREVLHELEQAGVQVVVVQADVSHQEQVARVLAELKETMPPLRGIFHLAGILDDGVLQQQTWARFARVLAPKVGGAWNLHTLTQHMPLDFFVLFSSMSSLWGTPGQGNYAAANAFLDALAHYRNERGLTAISINWGAWAEVGMAVNLESRIQQQRRALGLGEIKPDQGLPILAQVLQEGGVQLGVTPVDWRKYRRQFPDGSVPPFFSDVMGQDRLPTPADQPRLEQSELRQRLDRVSPGDRSELLMDHLRREVARVRGLEPAQVKTSQPLNELGIDSLMALELRNRITAELKVEVPMVKFLEGPSLAQITTLLLDQLTTGKDKGVAPLGPTPETSLHRLRIENRAGALGRVNKVVVGEDWEEGEL